MTDDELADRLARLPLPRPSALRAGYAAGLAAGRRQARAWQATTAVAAAVAVGVGLHRPPSPLPSIDRVVDVRPQRTPGTPPPWPSVADQPDDTLLAQRAMLRDPALTSPHPGHGGGGVRPVLRAWSPDPTRTAG